MVLADVANGFYGKGKPTGMEMLLGCLVLESDRSLMVWLGRWVRSGNWPMKADGVSFAGVGCYAFLCSFFCIEFLLNYFCCCSLSASSQYVLCSLLLFSFLSMARLLVG